MNIEDTKGLPFPGEDRWMVEIFNLQESLMSKYLTIEKSNGLQIPTAPWSLDDKLVQWRIKDMFWRTTEELAEACEKIVPGVNWRLSWDKDVEIRHFFEEMADALHFLVEASILASYHPPHWIWVNDSHRADARPEFYMELALFCKAAGLAANCLKNKPWKNSHMPTDHTKFHVNMECTWVAFADLFNMFGCTPQDVWNWYTRKHDVNSFRIRSNY